MFSRSILQALLFAVSFCHAASGDNRAGRNRVELASRGLDVPVSQHAHLRPRYEAYAWWTTQFEMWGKLPWAFAQCQNTFQSRVGWEIGVGAVNQLFTHVQEVTTAFSGFSGGMTFQDQVITTFKHNISQIFISWQAAIVAGSSYYGRYWTYAFKEPFSKFTILVKTLRDVCGHLGVDFRGLLLSLNLNPAIFAELGVDLASITGGGDRW